MSKISPYIILFMFLVVICFIENSTSISESKVLGKTLYVGGGEPGNYTYIQDAVENASDGDTVFVYKGVYHENIIVDKSVKLMGEDKYSTIIDADKQGDGVKIIANNVTFCNFTVRNTGIGNSKEYLWNAAIRIHFSDRNVIENVICEDTNYGIWTEYSDDNIIRNNVFYAFYDGISLTGKDNFLRNNSMFNSSISLGGSSISMLSHDIDTTNTVNRKPVYYYKNCIGITVPKDAGEVILVNCRGCIISNLTISKSTDGVELFFSDENVIINNRINNVTDFGIKLQESNSNIIQNNNISYSPFGIGFVNSSVTPPQSFQEEANCEYNIIKYNTFYSNIYFGLFIIGSNYNEIYDNNFIGNKEDARFIISYGNRWDGNYWDKWVGLKYPLLKKFPKIIYGSQIKKLWWMNLWFNLDWHPADKAYDKEGLGGLDKT